MPTKTRYILCLELTLKSQSIDNQDMPQASNLPILCHRKVPYSRKSKLSELLDANQKHKRIYMNPFMSEIRVKM